MSQFTSPLNIQFIDERTWKIIDPFEYHIDTYPSEKVVQVPTDFVTDFASIPRIFWVIISPFGEYGKAAVIHDYLYRTIDCGYTKVEADLIFLQAMQILKVPHWKQYVIYQSVHYFGHRAWNKPRGIK
jgi:hypothetical protein